MILDEPSAVLDDVEVEALFKVVRRLTAEGVGIIWISTGSARWRGWATW